MREQQTRERLNDGVCASRKVSADESCSSASEIDAAAPTQLSYQEAVRLGTRSDYETIQQMLESVRLADLEEPSPLGAEGVGNEPVRAPMEQSRLDELSRDFGAQQLSLTLRADPAVAATLAGPAVDAEALVEPVCAALPALGFSNIRRRAIYMWEASGAQVKKHFVVVADRDGEDVVFDFGADRFLPDAQGISNPLIAKEPVWADQYAKGSGTHLIKYKDFIDAQEMSSNLPAGMVPAEHFIRGATVLKAQRWFVKSKMAALAEHARQAAQAAETLPGQLGARADESWMEHVDLDFQLRREAAIGTAGYAGESTDFTNAVRDLPDVGPDIEKFQPLRKNLPGRMDMSADLIDYWYNAISYQIDHHEIFQRLDTDLSALETHLVDLGQAADPVMVNTVRTIKTVFGEALAHSEQLHAASLAAERSLAVKARIVGILARALNTKEPAILREAYKRFKEFAWGQYLMLDYHVNVVEYKAVIPMRLRPDKDCLAMAFILAGDPAGRIMIPFESFMLADPVETITHEATHLGIGSVDLQYLNAAVPPGGWASRLLGLEAGHDEWGTKMFRVDGLNYALGRSQHAADVIELAAIPPLTAADERLAQARLARLPMLRANAKMNNADTLVNIANAVRENFVFRRSTGTGPESWTVAMKPGMRVRRAIANEPDAKKEAYTPMIESVLSVAFEQAMELDATKLMTGAELENRANAYYKELNRLLATDDPG